MPYKMRADSKDKYIRFDLYGVLSKSDIDSAMKEVLAIRQAHNLNRILCDQLRLDVPPDDTVGFLTAVKFGAQSFAGTKLAIIRKQAGEERLFDIAAENRGVIVKIFTHEEEAKKWLRGQ
jgi:hypothetical protein